MQGAWECKKKKCDWSGEKNENQDILANNNNLGYYKMYNNMEIAVLMAKSGSKLKIKANSLESMWFGLDLVVQKLEQEKGMK